MDYSVIILTFNSQRYIGRCLESLLDSFGSLEASYEIFIIDNGSTDQSCDIIGSIKRERQANIELTEFDHNTGTTYSRNVGLQKAKGRNIIVMDSDAYCNADAVGGLAVFLDTNPECGMAVPKLTYLDGRFQLSTDTFPTLLRKAQRFLFLKEMEKIDNDPVDNKDIESEQTVDYAISAFWMFPKTVLDKVGLLDEKIFYSPEDVDYCLRIWKAGFQIKYLPDYSLIHDAQELSRGFRINKFTFLHIQGLLYYFLKHRYFWKLNALYKQIGRSHD